MRLIIAALAISLVAIPMASAQLQVKEIAPASAQTKTPQAQTGGGEPRNPEPHIYKLGEHLSEGYGRYDRR